VKFLQVQAHNVAQLNVLQVLPGILDRVQVRGVRRQASDKINLCSVVFNRSGYAGSDGLLRLRWPRVRVGAVCSIAFSDVYDNSRDGCCVPADPT
jgi:hypothetical protein